MGGDELHKGWGLLGNKFSKRIIQGAKGWGYLQFLNKKEEYKTRNAADFHDYADFLVVTREKLITHQPERNIPFKLLSEHSRQMRAGEGAGLKYRLEA